MPRLILIALLLITVLCSSILAIDPRYHTYGQMVDDVIIAGLTHQNITRVYTIGYTTTNQLPILAIKISDNPQIREDEPRILYNGMHHSTEAIGPEITLYLMWDLLTKYGVDTFITNVINSTEIWIVPMINPDGNYIVQSGIDTMWRKNTRDNNNNSIWDPGDGVDLNRNYDFLWDRGGSTDPNSREYRGPFPFSEGETQAMRDLALREKFIFDICYHSSKELNEGEAIYWPWQWGNRWCPDYSHVKSIAETLASRIISDNGGRYYAIYGRATEGGLARNWFYYAAGTFAYTIEVSHGYYPPGYRVDSICQRNLVGAYYLMQRVHGSQITGHITDSITGAPLSAEVRILEAYAPPDTIAPRTSDSLYGRFYRILLPGTYTVQIIKLGYDTVKISNVLVLQDQPTYLEIKLKPCTTAREKPITINKTAQNFQVLPTITKNGNKINFVVEQETNVNLKIYSENGRVVKTLVNDTFLPGHYSVIWDKKDSQGKKVADGVYFVKITSDKSVKTSKIIVKN